jgi:hypothetical protein
MNQVPLTFVWGVKEIDCGYIHVEPGPNHQQNIIVSLNALNESLAQMDTDGFSIRAFLANDHLMWRAEDSDNR